MSQPATISKKPANLEELKRLKQAKKEAKKLLNAKPQVQQVPPQVMERVFESVPDSQKLETVVGGIRIMTFNMLAQSLIKRELFPDSGDILKWKPRRKMIIEEIKLYNPDILTLQEQDNYEQFYKEVFENMGYNVRYHHHPTKKHGCGIAYKHEKFREVKYTTVDYNTDDTCAPSFMTGNIAQIIGLEFNDNPKVGFVVGNTHLYWRPSANYERFRQITIYEKRFLEFKTSLGEDKRWISLLQGDFNSEPIDPGYSILTKKHLEEAEIEDLDGSRSLIGQKDDKEGTTAAEDEEGGDIVISIEDLATVQQLLDQHENTRPWKSIYSHFGDINTDESEIGNYGEPRFTNYASQFQGTLDYLFVEKDQKSISIKSILMLPKEEYLKPSLPNRNFGSDHLCLVANIEF